MSSFTGTTAAGGDPSGPVDLVLPIYGAAHELELCLQSVLRYTELERHRLVATLDGPQPPEVEALLTTLPATALILRHPVRTGFVANANRGLALSQRDVVLLNSDTEVTPRWLEKLQVAASSDLRIGSVTPFSNDASLVSLPRPFVPNALPTGWSLERFAALIEEATEHSRPRLPTGVGFCLYLKRTLLNEVGLFDESRFGLGYGEENDLCHRATKAGYLHVLDDATFVYHAGQASFGPGLAQRVKRAERTLHRLHPEFRTEISRFLDADPLRPARDRVLALLRQRTPRSGTLRPAGPRRVVHLVHGWPPGSQAGTEVYARRLALRQAAIRAVAVYARRAAPERPKGEPLELWDQGMRVRLVANDFRQRDPLSRNALFDLGFQRDFGRFLDQERPDLLHVHHLAGHAFTLPAEAVRRGIPILYQIQDWWTPCARANLLDRERRLCSGPGLGRCARCLPATHLPPSALSNRALYALRALLGRWALNRADALVMGSEAIRASYEELGLLPPGTPVHVLPYGIERPAGAVARRAPLPPLRCGFIGSLLPHKGADLALRAFRGVDPARARLHLWGDLGASGTYAAELSALHSPAVHFEGRFDETRRAEVFSALDLLLVPSRGLESFGLIAYEALAEGIPVLAADRGALGLLGDPRGGPTCGATFDPDDPHALAAWIARLAADPGIVDRWSAARPRVKECDEHAEEIEALYHGLVGGAP